MPFRWHLAAATLSYLVLALPVCAQPQQDSIESVRAYLAAHPTDSDAHIRLGFLLLRAGHVDEANTEIKKVLQSSPDNSDALLAMSLIQFRTGDAAGAEATAAHGLAISPDYNDLRLAHARALRSLGRDKEAIDDVKRVLAREPSNRDAIDLLRSLRAGAGHDWEAGVTAEHDSFSDGRLAWQEYTATLQRQFSRGSVIGRFSDASRSGESDQQIDVDAYPSFRKGTYAYLNAGGSVHGVLYPDYRLGAELYQSLGRGFEASMGYRRLGFSRPVNIYTPSLTYYFGNSLVTARAYITQQAPKISQSYHVTYRCYFGDGTEYVGILAGHGVSHEIQNVNDIVLLDSNVIGGEVVKHFGAHVKLNVSLTYSRNDQVFTEPLSETALLAGFYLRF